MSELVIKKGNRILEIYESDSDGEVLISIHESGIGYGEWITKQDAIQIIDHLKKQFEL